LNARPGSTWQWQVQNRLTTPQDFAQAFGLGEDWQAFAQQASSRLVLGVTPYYAQLCQAVPALLKTILPDPQELVLAANETSDPMAEEATRPKAAIVRRYPNRALFLLCNQCATYCRYCTRARLVGDRAQQLGKKQWQEGLDWLAQETEIEEVILSGGEPLMLSDARLEWILEGLKKIPHLRFIRFSTKALAVMPQRITPDLARLLGRFKPLLINAHFVHPCELTPQAAHAVELLLAQGIMVSSQSVLLKGVNHQTEILAALFRELYYLGVRPYALYLCDWIAGASSFRGDLGEAQKIHGALRQILSGPMLPKLIADPPGGKAELSAQVLEGNQGYLLTDWQGKLVPYPKVSGPNEKQDPRFL